MSELRARNTIAGAIARAIHRSEAGPSYPAPEGATYKAALIERGASCQHVCADATRDFAVMLDRTHCAQFAAMRPADFLNEIRPC